MRRLLLLLLAPAVLAQPWRPLGADPAVSGFNGPVFAVATVPGGGYWVGGSFTEAPGGVPAWRLARWDGTRWSGPTTGPDGPIYVLGLAPDGSVVVGGSFSRVGDLPASNVARWRGTSWEALGEGTDRSVLSLAIGPGGSVVVGGEFSRPGRNLARWNGTAWDRIGGGVGSVVVAPVEVELTEAGPVKVKPTEAGLAEAARQSSSPEIVTSLVYGTDGALYVGGGFRFVGSGWLTEWAGNAGRWDGAGWTTVSMSAPEYSYFFGLDLAALPSGGALFAGSGSAIDKPGGALVEADAQGFRYVYPQVTYAHSLAVGPDGRVLVAGEWDGGEGVGWITGDGVEAIAASASVSDLAVEPDGTVIIAGRGVDRQPGGALFRQDGAGWSRDGVSTNGPISGLALGAYGELWAAGSFSVIGSTPAPGLASWDGARWQAVDLGGIGRLGSYPEVATDSAGRVAVLVSNRPTVVVRTPAGSWTELPLPGYTTALTWADGAPAVSGGFGEYPDYALGGVARWTGTEWAYSLPGQYAASLTVRAGRLVAAVRTEDGTTQVLEEVRPGEWVSLDAPDGVFVVGAGPDGTLFAGGYERIHTLRDGAWTTAPVRESVVRIEPGPDGTALVATARYNTGGARGTVYRVDGATAEPIAETDGPVSGMAQHGGALVLGGAFYSIDADAAAYVAARTDARAPAPPAERPPLEVLVAPNPARGDLTVAVPVTARAAVRVELFDTLGRRLAVLHDGEAGVGLLTVGFDARALTPGVYVVRAQVGADAVARSVTVVR